MPRVSRTPRNSVNDRPSRWRILLRRQRRLARPAALGLVGFGSVLAVTTLLHGAGPGGALSRLAGALPGLSGMRVRHVVIEGRANTPEKLLRAALDVHPGEPILDVSVHAAQQRIERLSWVAHATVERRLPDTVVVRLDERRPFAIWQHNGHFVLIDRQGQTVAEKNIGAFGTLPLVVGVGAPEHAAALLDALAAEPGLATRLVAATRVGERRWNLRMKNGTDVLLPEGAVKPALVRLAQMEDQHKLFERPIAVVDMRLPDRMVIRPVADQVPEPKDRHAGAAKRQT